MDAPLLPFLENARKRVGGDAMRWGSWHALNNYAQWKELSNEEALFAHLRLVFTQKGSNYASFEAMDLFLDSSQDADNLAQYVKQGSFGDSKPTNPPDREVSRLRSQLSEVTICDRWEGFPVCTAVVMLASTRIEFMVPIWKSTTPNELLTDLISGYGSLTPSDLRCQLAECCIRAATDESHIKPDIPILSQVKLGHEGCLTLIAFGLSGLHRRSCFVSVGFPQRTQERALNLRMDNQMPMVLVLKCLMARFLMEDPEKLTITYNNTTFDLSTPLNLTLASIGYIQETYLVVDRPFGGLKNMPVENEESTRQVVSRTNLQVSKKSIQMLQGTWYLYGPGFKEGAQVTVADNIVKGDANGYLDIEAEGKVTFGDSRLCVGRLDTKESVTWITNESVVIWSRNRTPPKPKKFGENQRMLVDEALSVVSAKIETQSAELLRELPTPQGDDQKFHLHVLSTLFHELGYDVNFFDSNKLEPTERGLVPDATQFLGVATEKPTNDMELTLDSLEGFGNSTKWQSADINTILANPQTKAELTADFQKAMAATLGVAPADIQVTKIFAGSVHFCFEVQNLSSQQKAALLQGGIAYFQNQFPTAQAITVSALFQKMGFDINSIDHRGHKTFGPTERGKFLVGPAGSQNSYFCN